MNEPDNDIIEAMRNIKFRAWDIPTKRMLPVVNLQFRLDYREDLNGAVSGVDVQADGSETLSNWELMQFTGLFDKNGVEIYEGDIIEHWDERYIVPNFTPLSRLYEAENIKEHYDGSDDWMSMSNVDWEVIGNIYENPELVPNNGGN